jgi:hypothetical protein
VHKTEMIWKNANFCKKTLIFSKKRHFFATTPIFKYFLQKVQIFEIRNANFTKMPIFAKNKFLQNANFKYFLLKTPILKYFSRKTQIFAKNSDFRKITNFCKNF